MPNDLQQNYAGLVAIAHTTPPSIQTSEDLAPLIGKSADWIQQHAGVKKRYVCQPYDDPAVLLESIAAPLIAEHGEPDLLINASAMPRQLLPDSSVFIARELGLSGVPTFSINATCLSFLVALNTAKALIQTGDYETVMICSCEFPSLSRNFDRPESAALFGDAAAVAIVRKNAGAVFQNFKMETYPAAAEFAQLRGGGVLKIPEDPNTTPADHLFDMQGDALLRFTLPRLTRFVRKYLESSNLSIDDIDLIVPHQASKSGMQILEKLGFAKSKIVNVLADYGNCVAASIPLALSAASQTGRIKRGDRVLLLGTAAGMSIGAGMLQW